jgi:sigma-B regulation protein RsbU (phosphoserine phosphatase)
MKAAGSKSSVPLDRLRVDRLTALVNASRLLNTSLDLEVILTNFLATALDLLSSERGTVYLINQEKTELSSFALAAAKEESQKPRMTSIKLPLGKGIAGHVAATGDPVLLNDAYADLRFNREIDKKTGIRTRNLLTVPIRNESEEIIGVMQVLNHPTGYSDEDSIFLIELSSQAAVAIERARLHEALVESSRIEKELDIARQIQERLLPSISLSSPNFEVVSFSHPCYAVGGDFFDLQQIDDGSFMVACGDVSGKGVPAALVNSLVKASYRHLLQRQYSPNEIMKNLNTFLRDNVLEGRFCTMVIARVDTVSRNLTYCNAGHNYPLLIRHDGQVEMMRGGGLPLGLNVPVRNYEEYQQPLHKGDSLLLYSDGVTEAVNPDEEEFGEARLIEAVTPAVRGSLQQGIDYIYSALKQFTQSQPQADDITMLLCRLP